MMWNSAEKRCELDFHTSRHKVCTRPLDNLFTIGKVWRAVSNSEMMVIKSSWWKEMLWSLLIDVWNLRMALCLELQWGHYCWISKMFSLAFIIYQWIFFSNSFPPVIPRGLYARNSGIVGSILFDVYFTFYFFIILFSAWKSPYHLYMKGWC
jgi:hypothetical protein